jgi:hypothetical protein
MRRIHNRLDTLEFWWRLIAHTRPLWPWLGRRIEDVRLRRRSGRIAVDVALRATIMRELRPLDILLERTTFRLADYVIPGHFHHAGVYLGRMDDLGHRLPRALALLERPNAPDGYVIEATHHGVRLIALERFLDVDSLAVLRDRSLHADDHARLYASATRELGKKYDYYFDLEDPGRQFCSKLVATIFSHLDFLSPTGGGRTLVPDHLVQKALIDPATPLVPVLLANARQGVVFDRLEERLARRIGVDPGALVTGGNAARERAAAARYRPAIRGPAPAAGARQKAPAR